MFASVFNLLRYHTYHIASNWETSLHMCKGLSVTKATKFLTLSQKLLWPHWLPERVSRIPMGPQDHTLRNTDIKSHFIQHEVYRVNITCFVCLFVFNMCSRLSRLTNLMSCRVRTKNSILEIPNTKRNAHFLSFLREKNIPQDFTLPLKDQQASIHLIALVSYGRWSAKAELELKLPNKEKGSPGKQVFILP